MIKLEQITDEMVDEVIDEMGGGAALYSRELAREVIAVSANVILRRMGIDADLKLCPGGCSLWSCGRPINHPGPCQPKES